MFVVVCLCKFGVATIFLSRQARVSMHVCVCVCVCVLVFVQMVETGNAVVRSTLRLLQTTFLQGLAADYNRFLWCDRDREHVCVCVCV